MSLAPGKTSVLQIKDAISLKGWDYERQAPSVITRSMSRRASHK